MYSVYLQGCVFIVFVINAFLYAGKMQVLAALFLILLNFISDKWTRHLLAFQIAEELQSFDCWYDGHSQDSVGAYYRKEEVESCW